MEKTIACGPNQSMLDIVLTACGTLEGGMQFCAENDVSISTIPATGTIYSIPAGADLATNNGNLLYFQQYGITPGTAATALVSVLRATVVLKPMMQVIPNIPDAPATTGYYSYDLKAAAGFVNVHDLVADYITTNDVFYKGLDLFDPGLSSPSITQYAVSGMPARSVAYRIPWTAGVGKMLIWSDLTAAHATITFADDAGNTAYAAPVVMLESDSQHVFKYLMGDMLVETISATEDQARIRLTKSHTPLTTAIVDSYGTQWVGLDALAFPPVSDPDDPTNPDKCILELPAGSYTIGVRTIYNRGGVFLPSSVFTAVIEIA